MTVDEDNKDHAENESEEEEEDDEKEIDQKDDDKDEDGDEEGPTPTLTVEIRHEDLKEEDPAPKANFKPPPVAPKEAYGTGVNKYVYYVCNSREFLIHKIIKKHCKIFR